MALFVSTFPPDESHNFVLVQVFTVVKPALGGRPLQRKLAFLEWVRPSLRKSGSVNKHHWFDN